MIQHIRRLRREVRAVALHGGDGSLHGLLPQLLGRPGRSVRQKLGRIGLAGRRRRATGIDAVEFARTVAGKGAGEILLTSMDRDGTRVGFNIPLTRAIADAVDIPVIASGGVGTLEHLVEGVRDGHASAVLAASIFHFGTYTIAEAKAHMAAAGIPVRLE